MVLSGSNDSGGVGDVGAEVGRGMVSIEFRIFAIFGQSFSSISNGSQRTQLLLLCFLIHPLQVFVACRQQKSPGVDVRACCKLSGPPLGQPSSVWSTFCSDRYPKPCRSMRISYRSGAPRERKCALSRRHSPSIVRFHYFAAEVLVRLDT